jgi:hypothetical protein
MKAAVAALVYGGQYVGVEINVAFVKGGPLAPSPVVADSGGVLRLNATDVLFLRGLKITVDESETSRR